MKKIIALLTAILIFTTVLGADVVVRSRERTETYADGSLKESEQGGESHFWYGKDKAAYITPVFTLILKRAEKKLIIINPRRKTYVEASLPIDPDKILTEELKMRHRAGKTTGTVEKTDRTRTLAGLESTAYEVKYWTLNGDTPANIREITVWAARHEKVDISLHDELLECLRMIYNRDEKLRQELRKIDGLQMLLEFVDRRGGKEIKYIEEVTEIVEKEAPADVYAAPKNYKKLERLSSQDF